MATEAVGLPATTKRFELAGAVVEVQQAGSGRPLLFLHGERGLDFEAPWSRALAANASLIAASHPGFGHSELPRWVSTVEDISYVYLDLLEALDLRDAVVVGVGLGGWIAASIAVKSTERIGHLVLANPIGIKIGDRETRDFADIYATKDDELYRLLYHDPAVGTIDRATTSDDDALVLARNRETTALLCWSPYFHDPKLRHRLHRIGVPTLVLWGESDGLASVAYGQAYAGLISDAAFATIPSAGHYPHLEQPIRFAEHVFAFAGLTPNLTGATR
jgi:pimeloyl-ACP methyl ester carboxylesterase